ncbi:MAG: aa3-type cytochrome c oxidase subunit IV [Pseudomonadota bacterium]
MADHHDDHFTPGSMDISQHQRAWAGFVTFVKYSTGFCLLIMAFLAVFRTHG